MKIITWNVNRCNGTWDWVYNDCDLAIDGRERYAERIVKKIVEHVQEKDDIAVLQEFPMDMKKIIEKYLGKELSLHTWYLDGEEAEEKLPMNPKVATVAITKSDSSWQKIPFDEQIMLYQKSGERFDFANRYIVMHNINTDRNLLGIHMKMKSVKDNKDYDAMWQGVYNNIQKFAYIIGDFNNNELIQEGKYAKLKKKGYSQMIEDDIITYNKAMSSIDNIFIRSDILYSRTAKGHVIDYCWVYGEKEEFRRKYRYSDHNLCYVDMR